LELIKFDVSNTSYYVEVENCALLRGAAIKNENFHGKVMENF